MVTEVEMTVWIRLVQGSEKGKDQDKCVFLDGAHGKSERVHSKGGCCVLKKRFLILRDEEVGDLKMVTADEDLVLRGD